ncbi:MAG: hypothetical protein RIB71_08625 [Imperialibacter sp.]|uniref:hypothetical protein n=1 Tax=Imperialibacter sp. TaxID=2038411 RepID=UPI0032EAB27B
MAYVIFIVGIFSVFCGSSRTEQTPDLLVIGGETYFLKSFPLDDLHLRTNFEENDFNSGCWRNYQATWHVRNDSLFLVKITGCSGSDEISMPSFFASRTPKLSLNNDSELFAGWYNAVLVHYRIEVTDPKMADRFLWDIDWRTLEADEKIVLTFRNGVLADDQR